ncbi:MAG: hypothetical protein BGO31_00785 [Bacteroidetes bacterium 43-16]|nr:MAG: hypothetical protein BGO31_00785 [Bacteroidetes bacterium 43-16]
MKILLTFILAGLFYSSSFGQTAQDLYKEKNYPELAKLESNADKLSSDELYMVGYAFYRLENDHKAIELYDKAMAKGLDNGTIHFYKGLSLCYQKKYEAALKEIEISLNREPGNQEYMNQKALIYKYQGKEEEALRYFVKATELDNTYGEPFYWVASIHHGKQNLKKALELYYVALEKVPKHNSHYLTTLQNIGQLEYTFTKNYQKSAQAYAQAISLKKGNYDSYPKLIKAYNGAKQFTQADSVFDLMKVAYTDKKLPEDNMKFGNTAIYESAWKGQKLIVYKSFASPKEMLDVSYKIYLLDKAGDKIERVFMVEQTLQMEEDDVKHLLCERDKKSGAHITYSYGWASDTILPEALTKAVELVLDEKVKMGASSNFRGN